MNIQVATVLSWIPIFAPVLAVLAMILWDTRGSPSSRGIHWDRVIELIILSLLVITGIIQLGINDRQGKITKRQTEIMERQVKISDVVERPWLAIAGTEVLSPLTLREDSAALTIRFTLKNTGHVPAAHVLIDGKFFIRSIYTSKKLDDVWTECELFRSMPLETRGSGISIFPDQQQWMIYTTKMITDDVKQLGTIPVNYAPTFAGCIDYGWGDDVSRHQTRFVYEIDKKGPDGKAIMLSPAGGDIPIADVIVNLNPLLAGNPD